MSDVTFGPLKTSVALLVRVALRLNVLKAYSYVMNDKLTLPMLFVAPINDGTVVTSDRCLK